MHYTTYINASYVLTRWTQLIFFHSGFNIAAIYLYFLVLSFIFHFVASLYKCQLEPQSAWTFYCRSYRFICPILSCIGPINTWGTSILSTFCVAWIFTQKWFCRFWNYSYRMFCSKSVTLLRLSLQTLCQRARCLSEIIL